MNCPQCNGEMAELAAGEERIHACAECGEWIDGAQLQALLLHANLPGIGSLGGRAKPDEATGTCGVCGVNLIRIEQGRRDGELFHEICEDCGSVFVPFEPPAAEDYEAARARLVEFFRAFTVRPGAGR